jgi:hypothetical protein
MIVGDLPVRSASLDEKPTLSGPDSVLSAEALSDLAVKTCRRSIQAQLCSTKATHKIRRLLPFIPVKLSPYPWEQALSPFGKIRIPFNPEEHPLFDHYPQNDRRHKGEKKDRQCHPIQEIDDNASIEDDHSRIGRMPRKTVWPGRHNLVLRESPNPMRIELPQCRNRP